MIEPSCGQSKWGWWDIWFTTWMVDELGFSIQSASVTISFIAALFGVTAPVSGMLGDRLGERRMHLMALCMTWCVVLYTFMGPWQLSVFGLGARRAMVFVYLAGDGLQAATIEAQFSPLMLALAEAKATGGPSEHLTNFVTAFGQTAMNLGSVCGPLIAAPIVDAAGFRGALFTWGTVYSFVTVWAWIRVARRACERRKSREAVASAGEAAGAAAHGVELELPPAERGAGSSVRNARKFQPLEDA